MGTIQNYEISRQRTYPRVVDANETGEKITFVPIIKFGTSNQPVQVSSTLARALQNINNTTNSNLALPGLDLDYYRRHIPPDQFRLLTAFLSYAAPGNFDPAEFFYPEDL